MLKFNFAFEQDFTVSYQYQHRIFIQINPLYLLCCLAPETVNHLFTECAMVRLIWRWTYCFTGLARGDWPLVHWFWSTKGTTCSLWPFGLIGTYGKLGTISISTFSLKTSSDKDCSGHPLNGIFLTLSRCLIHVSGYYYWFGFLLPKNSVD